MNDDIQYRVVRKQNIIIGPGSREIACPMSHPIVSRVAAMRWMIQRGMQIDCEVVPESIYLIRSGLPKSIINQMKEQRKNHLKSEDENI